MSYSFTCHQVLVGLQIDEYNIAQVTWASRSLQTCRLCLLWTTFSAAASRGGLFWPCARLAAVYCFPCKFLYNVGRNGISGWHAKSMWTARVCTGQPGAAPTDNGHSPAQYPSATIFFPSNAFMASARSLQTFNCSKRWIEIIVQGCR